MQKTTYTLVFPARQMLNTPLKSDARRSTLKVLPVALALGLFLALCGQAQMSPPPAGPLDPARNAVLRPPSVSRETAQLIWTANDAAAHDSTLQAKVRGQDDKTGPHFFRAHFNLSVVPQQATLYLAGPRSATVYLNGTKVLEATDDGARPKNLSVITAAVTSSVHAGDNVLALEVVRGHSSLHTGASPTINQVTYGEVLAVKIVPEALAIDAAPILVSDTHWRSILATDAGWQLNTFDDSPGRKSKL